MELLKFVNEKNFTNGEWVKTPYQIAVINPANLEVIGHVPSLLKEDVINAIDGVVQGYESWSASSYNQRIRFLKRWHKQIIDHAAELAYIITLEQGKTLADSKREVAYGASFIEWFSDIEINRIEKVGSSHSHKIITEFEPVGPVGAITPWNFPLAMVTRKLAPALLAGCSAILKPSSLTPFSALAILRLAEIAGLSKGVVNVVTGNSDLIGRIICDDFRLRKISFTGSTQVGKLLYQNSANTLKRMSLELGGNAPYIIFSDVDINKQVDDLIIAKIRSNGQSCTSPNRIFIQSEIYESFIEALTEKFKQLRCRNGMDIDADIGPLINQSAVDNVMHLLKNAIEHGARITCGGTNERNFLAPTVLVDCQDDMTIASREIFGPVIACYKFENEEEIINRANSTEYGLQAYICTNDIEKANRVLKKLDYGMVSINSPIASNASAPFSGRKASGFGIEGGEQGIFEYLNTKYVNLNL